MILLVLRVILFGYFLYCYFQHKEQIPKRSVSIYRIFLILGIAYFSIVPVSLLLTYLYPPFQRQYLYTLVSNMGQVIAAGILLYQQSSTRTGYFKASISG